MGMADDPMLRQLHACVAQQQVQIDGLRDECAALRECLEAAGILATERFLAQLHRRRFAAALGAHPTPAGEASSFGDLLPLNELTLAFAKFAGLPTMRALNLVA